MLTGQMMRRAGLCLVAAMGVSMASQAAVQKARFGTLSDGRAVDIFTLTNKNGVEARVSSWGAALVSLKIPDRTGKLADVVLGLDTAEAYEQSGTVAGASVGRYANRIAGGSFVLDGVTYSLAKNNGPNTLHGGIKGFHKQLWTAEPLASDDGVVLTYVSADAEEGFPGALTLKVTYRLAADNALSITYDATTTKPTVINFTNHSYFNLSGHRETPITGEILSINADHYTPVDDTLIPTGEIRPVAGSPFDFRAPIAVGTYLAEADVQMKRTKGYDLNWVLNQPKTGALTSAAVVSDPISGRVMEVKTTEPGVQFFTGNILEPASGPARFALCLETQHFPDSPHHANFPTTVLRPGESYHSETVFAFHTTK